jgi:hypothetical protein
MGQCAQCKSKDGDFKSYAYAGVSVAVCKFEHWGFKRAKERWDSASPGAKDFKSY